MGLSVSRIEVEKWTEDDVVNLIIKHIGGNFSKYGTNICENGLNGITLIHIGEKQLRNCNDNDIDIDNTNIMQKSLLDINITNLIHQSRLIMEWKSIMKQICNNNNDDNNNNNNIISQDDNNNDKNNNNNNKKKQQQDGDITTTTNDNKNDNVEGIVDTTNDKHNQKEDASTTTTSAAVSSFIRPYSWNRNDIKYPTCSRFNDKTLKVHGRLYKQRLRIDIPHRPISPGNKPEVKCQLHRWSSGLKIRAAILRCRECNVHLCVTCFQIYHETEDLLAIKNDLSIRFHQEKLDKIELSNNNKKQKTQES